MTSLYGLRIIESDLVPIRWRYKRARGGYMNRWLIRVREPVFEYFVSEILGAVYVHQLNMPALRDALMAVNLARPA